MKAEEVYAILNGKLKKVSGDVSSLGTAVTYKGSVATADDLPITANQGDMYNIESKSAYGEAGMNVAWNGAEWDALGAVIDTSLLLSKDEAVEIYLQKTDISDWAKASTKPTYTADEVGALPDTTEIPSKLSDLSDDSTHRVVTDAEKTAWNAKAETSDIPTDEIAANTAARHTHSNKAVLDGIAEEDIDTWNNKSDFSGSYEDLTDKPTIPTVPTEEIEANTKARHTHDNKDVLDGITSEKVESWDNKSDFSGSYNDLTDKPTIPDEYELPAATDTVLGGVKVDTALSDTSTNPVQNKAVKAAVDLKMDKAITDSVTGLKYEIGLEDGIMIFTEVE